MADAADLIRALRLEPHPEGGYYRELYRSDDVIPSCGLPARYDGSRPSSTSIYYLLQAGECSRLHRIRSDEIWHHYQGSPIALHLLHQDGTHQRLVLGPPPQGEGWQVVVPHGVWFGAELFGDPDHALVGCTVAPGFSYADFELADRATLLRQFPQHAALIQRLT